MPPEFAADLDEFERRIEAFERAWQEGHAPTLSEFVPNDPQVSSVHDRLDLLVELVKIDLEYRWRAARQHTDHSEPNELRTPRLEEYLVLLPELRDLPTLPVDLICEEYRVRHRWGDRPEASEFAERFPAAAGELRPMLNAVRAEIEADTVVPSDTHLPSDTLDAPTLHGTSSTESQTNIGKYQIISLLDSGGQASVYRALHPTLECELAIKISKSPLGSEDPHRELLVAEGRLLAELQHPNIARIFDLDFDQGRPFLVMEYVRGTNLSQYAQQHELTVREIASLLAKIAHAVSVAHARGVVHQDIKPGNIVVDAQGVPRLIDFGLARLSDAWSADEQMRGSVSGTAPYMPPEQARGDTDQIGPASDVFALGAVLYFLLTGRAPFAGRDVHESLQMAQRCEFDKQALDTPRIPARARDICLRAMAESPSHRFVSADAMADQLDRLASPERTQNWRGIAAAILIVGVLVAGAWWLVNRDHATQPPVTPPADKPVEGPSDVAAVSRHPQGRRLHKEFRLKIDLPGGVRQVDQIRYVDGDTFVVAADTERPCYVGIWYIGEHGTAERIFPQGAQDAVLLPAVPRDLYRSTASVSTGKEYIHVVASNRPLHELTDAQLESYITAPPADVDPRGLKPLDAAQPAIAEYFIEFHVDPAK